MTEKEKALVAKVIDEYTVVINRGSSDGVKVGDIYKVFYLSDEDIIDPETGESLGKLEFVVGNGVVTNVQTKMSTLESNDYTKPKTRTITKTKSNNNIAFMLTGYNNNETVEEITPPEQKGFNGVSVGNIAILLKGSNK